MISTTFPCDLRFSVGVTRLEFARRFAVQLLPLNHGGNMGKEVDVEEVLIHSYSRNQAVEDGVLVDVSETAREAGFRYPVALTHAVWDRYVAVPEEAEGQDEDGRLWDILWMLKHAIASRSEANRGSVREFQLLVRNDNRRARIVTLKSVCGPGDDGEPVLTIMLPSED
jgi:hypothetical protein